MQKKLIRKWLMEFFQRPKTKWATIGWVWERGLVLGWSALLNLVALVTGNGSLLVVFYGLVAVAVILLYLYLKR